MADDITIVDIFPGDSSCHYEVTENVAGEIFRLPALKIAAVASLLHNDMALKTIEVR